jgi:putative Mn2+ efflux pump MntP
VDYISIILIAVSLAMDCFAVAIANGIRKKTFDKFFTLKMSLIFGIFQGGMFLLSCVVCTRFNSIDGFTAFMDKADHWVAFVLLGGIGAKMIIDDLKKSKPCEEIKNESSKNENIMLLSLAVATSIDAFITGLIFVPYQEKIIPATIIIGLASLILAVLGMIIGVKVGCRFRLKVGAIGGGILILIGLKILAEHLFF